MKMSEMIAAYGDENLQLQNLDQCIRTLDFHHKKGTTISFGTTMGVSKRPGVTTEKLGVVLWLDRDRVAEILATSNGGDTDGR